ncbi:hypothetical protein [Quadrisphaera sp. DSM 44207]|uniref:hypothetical protein n=1 Tax=Quadrisphaera sp. DSM 44207 TaxID=1881057 RepID=UPI000890CEA8|nr:hypothetical protein [Quadrisphaera sp. DSM 44207]SDQ34844.1 hypothetical protein SAMN05428996_1345 [Quadrisphaera sp. DSM 44207]
MPDQEELVLRAGPCGGSVPDAALQRDVLDLLAAHPLGLRRADLRSALARAYAERLPPAELAVLDTRIGHGLARLKTAGDVVHDDRRQRYRLRPRTPGTPAGDLPAPPVRDLPGLDDAEQDELF